MQFLLASFLLAIYLKASGVLSSNQCWRPSYTREIKSALSDSCPSGYTKSGLLCYEPCKSGYNNVAGVCWEKCESGYTDIGALCARNAHTYGLGCCCTVFSKKCCRKDCNSGYNRYPCTCTRNAHIYAKNSYVVSPTTLSCPNGLDKVGLFCYEPCKEGFNAESTVCWKKCEGTLDTECGMSCQTSSSSCVWSIVDQVGALVESLTGDWVGASLMAYSSYGYLMCTGDLEVCFIQNVTSCSNPSYPLACGDMICAKDSKTCALYMTQIVMDSIKMGIGFGFDDNLLATMDIKGCDGTVYVFEDSEDKDWSDWGDF